MERPFSRFADTVYGVLKKGLYVRIRPGDRLTESAISQRFGVSRIPVREALQRMVQEGYLKSHLRNGYTVTMINRKQVDELNCLRLMFEQAAVSAICSRQQAPHELVPLWKTWRVARAGRARTASRLSALNRHFHTTLVSCTGNGEMTRLHGEIFDRIELVQRLDFIQESRVDATYREHGEILESLMALDEERARTALGEHIHASNAAVRELMHQLDPANAGENAVADSG